MSFTEQEYLGLTLEHLDDVCDLLVNHFYPRDIITLGLGLSPENRLTLDLPHIRTCLASGLSVGAREKSTRRLVGVILNYIFITDSTPKQTLKNYTTEAEVVVDSTPNIQVLVDPIPVLWVVVDHIPNIQMMQARFRKVLAIMTDKIDCPEEGSVMCSSRACVHSDFGQRAILSKLAEKSVIIATKQGFNMTSLIMTNPRVEKMLLRLGYKVHTTFDFCTLEEGLLDLSRMDHKQFKIMTKYLSPKSQL